MMIQWLAREIESFVACGLCRRAQPSFPFVLCGFRQNARRGTQSRVKVGPAEPTARGSRDGAGPILLWFHSSVTVQMVSYRSAFLSLPARCWDPSLYSFSHPHLPPTSGGLRPLLNREARMSSRFRVRLSRARDGQYGESRLKRESWRGPLDPF